MPKNRANLCFSQAHREHSRQIRCKLSRLIQTTPVSQVSIGPHESHEPLPCSKYVSDLTGRIEQHRRRGATVRGRVQHEVRADRIANSVLDLPGDPLKSANGLRCCLIALEEEQGPSLGDQVEERHRLTAAGVDECRIGDAVAGSKPSTMATQPAASLFPVIGIDGEGRATIANSQVAKPQPGCGWRTGGILTIAGTACSRTARISGFWARNNRVPR